MADQPPIAAEGAVALCATAFHLPGEITGSVTPDLKRLVRSKNQTCSRHCLPLNDQQLCLPNGSNTRDVTEYVGPSLPPSFEPVAAQTPPPPPWQGSWGLNRILQSLNLRAHLT